MHPLSEPIYGTSLGQVLTNFRKQLARAIWLEYISVTASRSRSLFFPTERIGGDRDDRDRLQSWIGLDPARRLVTTHARKLDRALVLAAP